MNLMIPDPLQQILFDVAACTSLAGGYAAIGGRCWPEPASAVSAEHDAHRGLTR
jgi:hypothetical protein